MLWNATILLDSRKYPDGFYLVVVAAPCDSICNVVEDGNKCETDDKIEPIKDITITIKSNSDGNDYLLGTLVITAAYLLIFLVSSLMSAYGFRYDYYRFEDLKELLSQNLMFKQKQEAQKIKSLSTVLAGKEKGRKWMTAVLARQQSIPGQEQNIENIGEIEDELFLDIDELDSVGVQVDQSHKDRLKRDLTLNDLSKKINDPSQRRTMYQKSDLHWILLVVVSMYYSLPTMQMVFKSNFDYEETGNQDLCFYNHLCQKPLGNLRDFNHLFSNLGYIVFGLLFNCLVYLRKKNFNALSCSDKKFDPHLHGVPQQSGVYYAMGSSLVMEGVMSSCYHVCPATVTFQFDTTYMYLIAILMFIKLYQARHPDVSCSAFKAYMGLGVALVLEVMN